MAKPTAGNKRATVRRRLEPVYPSFAFVMTRFWLFMQFPVLIQPAPQAVRRTLTAYDADTQRVNVATREDDDWAMVRIYFLYHAPRPKH